MVLRAIAILSLWAVCATANVTDGGVLELPAGDALPNTPERITRDVDFSADLWDVTAISFECRVEELSDFTRFSLYLKSGEGWYHLSFAPVQAGCWLRVHLPRASAEVEGKVVGWQQIERLRFSGWRAVTNGCGWAVRNLRFERKHPNALILSGDDNSTVLHHIQRIESETEMLGLTPLAVSDQLLDKAPKTPLILLPRGLPKSTHRDEFLKLALERKQGVLYCYDHPKGQHKPLTRTALEVAAPSLSNTLAQAAAARALEEQKEATIIAKMPSGPTNEVRAIWCHSPLGLPGKSWGETAALVRQWGLNTLVVNLAWGGWDRLEWYPQIAEACRTNGVDLYVWKVCWHTWWGGDGVARKQAKREGRLMVNRHGKTLQWLCPSHPKNVAIELAQLRRIAEHKPKGIQLDYIRYPESEGCYCSTCREAFEREHGAVTNWPRDVLSGGQKVETFRRYRAETITRFVRQFSSEIRRMNPTIRLSAAVYESPYSATKSIGQPWHQWCQEGLLDFVSPMDYCDETSTFAGLLSRQKVYTAQAELLPGIGLSSTGARHRHRALRLAEQIQATREAKLNGFFIFGLGTVAEETLPILRAGPLRSPEP